MPEGQFKCDTCGQEISNPYPEPIYCPHAYPCGMLILCRTTSTTCEATKLMRFGGCTHTGLVESSQRKAWPAHKWISKIKKWVPWDLVHDKQKGGSP